jgi:hypothetical protein
MKKIPSLFIRNFENHKVSGITKEITPGCEWVLAGEGVATEKLDGTCCMVLDGVLYKRFDFKPGRKLPDGAIPCQENPDDITGHFPHWVKCDHENPADKWHTLALQRQPGLPDGTYELCGPHFQSNPYHLKFDTLFPHGDVLLTVDRDFDAIRDFLRDHMIEGIVFHRGNGEMCKIKRSDFGFKWPE